MVSTDGRELTDRFLVYINVIPYTRIISADASIVSRTFYIPFVELDRNRTSFGIKVAGVANTMFINRAR
jgi:hypothetical protein